VNFELVTLANESIIHRRHRRGELADPFMAPSPPPRPAPRSIPDLCMCTTLIPELALLPVPVDFNYLATSALDQDHPLVVYAF
jgi:hypothetical protein